MIIEKIAQQHVAVIGAITLAVLVWMAKRKADSGACHIVDTRKGRRRWITQQAETGQSATDYSLDAWKFRNAQRLLESGDVSRRLGIPARGPR